MSIIDTEEGRKYFSGFKCDVLTANQKHKEMLKGFVFKKANNQLEAYIRDEDKAWAEDFDGETRVYLVKNESDEIALF